MFRALIDFTIRMGNTPRTRAAIAELMGLPKDADGKRYDLIYFVDNRKRLFIYDNNYMREDVENSCVNHAFDEGRYVRNGYVDYVRWGAKDTGTMRDYDNYYANYLASVEREHEAAHQRELNEQREEAARYAAAQAAEETESEKKKSSNFAGASSRELGVALMI